jgi:uncharacterized protein
MTLRSKLAPVLLAVALLAAAAPRAGAQNSEFVDKGPSFKCDGVRLVTEKLICRHKELAALDLEVAEALDAAIRSADPAEARRLRFSQRRWEGQRNQCAARLECLLTSYYGRIAELAPAPLAAARTLAGEEAGPGGPSGTVPVEEGFEDPYLRRMLIEPGR